MIIQYLLTATVLAGIMTPASGFASTNPADRRCVSCHEEVAEHMASVPSIHKDEGITCVSCHRDDFARRAPHRGEPVPATCRQCHDAAHERHQMSPHSSQDENGRLAASCADCHGSHDILPGKDSASRVYHLNVAATCAGCHTGDGAFDPQRQLEQLGRWVAGAYSDGIHGQLMKRGQRVAPSCVTCHGVHAVGPADDPNSMVAPENVTAMCGGCHEGTSNAFRRGRHGTHRQDGGTAAPGCVDCHSPHLTLGTALPAWKLEATRECGGCHEDEAHTYRDTFHGKVTSLGFVRVASCADCHGAHEVLPSSDPRSPIAPGNLIDTCGRCHTDANANFVMYNPHADRHDRAGEPLLYWSSVFMHGLLIGVFGLFGLHTLLWAWRSWRDALASRFGGRAASEDEGKPDGRGD
jgi:nitrate/TMAO reductase-like tetraheme cytochrome c subunit